jgi:uncharacterized surface protein with fasciclin (FAS1) repeats
MLVLKYLLLVGSASAWSWHEILHSMNPFWRLHSQEQVQQQVTVQASNGAPHLLQLATSLNLTTCVEKLQEVHLDRVLNHEGWFTVFCPTNEAFQYEKFYPGESTLTDKMRLHVGRGRVNSTQFKNEETFRSLLSKRDVRINVYPSKGEKASITTANGCPVVSVDHKARNGFIQVISKVMASVYKRDGSVISEIEECCPQHSFLIELFKLAGVYDALDQADTITFLAPVNSAFDRVHPDFLNHLKSNKPLLKKVLAGHIIPGTWYTAGLINGDKLKNWNGDLIPVEKTQTGEVRFNGAESSLTDVTAHNGVVHSISDLILSKSTEKEVEVLLRTLNGESNGAVHEATARLSVDMELNL